MFNLRAQTASNTPKLFWLVPFILVKQQCLSFLSCLGCWSCPCIMLKDAEIAICSLPPTLTPPPKRPAPRSQWWERCRGAAAMWRPPAGAGAFAARRRWTSWRQNGDGSDGYVYCCYMFFVFVCVCDCVFLFVGQSDGDVWVNSLGIWIWWLLVVDVDDGYSNRLVGMLMFNFGTFGPGFFQRYFTTAIAPKSIQKFGYEAPIAVVLSSNLKYHWNRLELFMSGSYHHITIVTCLVCGLYYTLYKPILTIFYHTYIYIPM